MKVFVTGATGFIGAHLVKRLSDEGITVHVLLRSIEKGQYLNFKNIHLFKGDILDLASIEKAIDGCTHVYHIAACTSVWEANPQTYHDINVIGTKNVLDASRKFNISKIVATSTCGVYGPSTNGVITEEKENDRSYFNHYESTKEESEILVKKYIEEYDLDIITVNPTRVYGPNLIGEFNPMTEMINRYVNGKWKFLPGKGDQIGNYVYIHDVVEGHLSAMKLGKKGANYILGGENTTYVSFLENIDSLTGQNQKLFNIPIWIQLGFAKIQLLNPILFGKPPAVTPTWVSKFNLNWEVSSQKSIDELGLQPISVEDGIGKTIKWLADNKRPL